MFWRPKELWSFRSARVVISVITALCAWMRWVAKTDFSNPFGHFGSCELTDTMNGLVKKKKLVLKSVWKHPGRGITCCQLTDQCTAFVELRPHLFETVGQTDYSLGSCQICTSQSVSPSRLQDTMGRGYPVATHSKMAVWWTVRVRFSGPTRIIGSL